MVLDGRRAITSILGDAVYCFPCLNVGKPYFAKWNSSPGTMPNFLTWDTVHFWPGRSIGDGKSQRYVPGLPSAPGAFYALHCHWRWSYLLQYPSDGDKILIKSAGLGKYLGDTPFKGIPTPTAGGRYGIIGGPLVDPNLPNQTIVAAILKQPTLKEPGWKMTGGGDRFSFVDWFSTINTPRSNGFKPTTINKGEDLKWILSFECQRTAPPTIGPDFVAKYPPFGGSVFFHGTYFAHNLIEPQQPFDWTKGEGHAIPHKFLFRFPHGKHLGLPLAKAK
ncbi:MAG: hypothetical protein M3R13_11125 [Armatimonadota bacterium]|nr:hypothetical protein [Armatimonadota bacterium]